jgi:hypothetical protein
MKFKGTIIGEASGSLASMVFSHNRGGQYIRQRTIPTNPNTSFQQAIRTLVSQLTSLWQTTLTAPQRDAWDVYAEAVPLLDPLGEPRNVGGLGMYIRSNVARLQADPTNLPRVDDAPTIFNLGDFTAPSFGNLTEAGQTVDITFNAGDDWANEDDAAMIIFSSRPQNASINFFKGPYRYSSVILGDSVAPPVSPETDAVSFPFVLGQKVFFRAVVTRADGRMSSTFRSSAVGVA